MCVCEYCNLVQGAGGLFSVNWECRAAIIKLGGERELLQALHAAEFEELAIVHDLTEALGRLYGDNVPDNSSTVSSPSGSSDTGSCKNASRAWALQSWVVTLDQHCSEDWKSTAVVQCSHPNNVKCPGCREAKDCCIGLLNVATSALSSSCWTTIQLQICRTCAATVPSI